ncbi:hypothetical protein CFIMG_003612RA [Ceratocystis fimbriata CBS 114723]|uniref:UDENN FLCN/SMCR8-type domain-containing protein n=1 Tax=Ceratocystis fimbriata CBS 114723 TaxID=1035309 RepID=A0A2C5X3B0_9PEZI|nr:hypothetical protein CFIMG_003612RA [Ceratocystis fimbriata CBS 114723]
MTGDVAPVDSPALEQSLRRLSTTSHKAWSSQSSDEHHTRDTLIRSSTTTPSSRGSISPTETTPPDSPRKNEPQRRDSGFRKTYDENVTRRAGPCDNCALSVPPNIRQAAANDDGRAPVLRSTLPYSKMPSSWQNSPPSSTESAASDSEADEAPSSSTRQRTSTSRAIREACIRTLSFETLPRGPVSRLGSIPGFVTTHSAGYAASGGPIFFGDPVAGYTTAYIFRISDVHARGHKRVYAFMAISTHGERQVMQKFEYLARRFRQMAASIQQMAENEADKATDPSPSPVLAPGPFALPTLTSQFDTSSSTVSSTVAERDRGGSSFLSSGGGGLTRRMGAGGPGVSLKARGLAELVGQPDFFYQMHSSFAKLLYEMEHNKYN